MTLLEDTPTFTLWHDASCACLYATWHGKHTSSLTRGQYDLIRWHVRVTSSTKLLNDSLLDEDGWSNLTQWLAKDAFRLLAQDGVQLVGWVLPRHLGALYDTARVLAQLTQPLVDTFIDVQAAYDWLHRWPFVTPAAASEVSLTAAAFLLLAPTEQVTLTQQQGQPLAPRWEPEYYVKPYRMLDSLLVEVYYQVHSGVFYQVKTQVHLPESGPTL